jgi:catechol 2,3-dioxygenase-like lactoylglutathione lyase family enzyme
MIQGIEHAAIAAKNVERLADFYVRTLGFEINYRGKSAIFVKAGDGSMIEIIPAEGELSEAAPKTPGLRHLALTVTGFETECERLAAAGVAFLEPPLIKSGNKVVFFRDPEGNILHLIERPEPLP